MSDAKLKERIKALEAALRPFAACVFNDNGDVTISTGHLTTLDWMKADAAFHDFRGDASRKKRP